MAKYKNIKELAEGFKSGELENWVLMVDNDNTYLRWIGGGAPDHIKELDKHFEWEEQKEEEALALWDSPYVYILDQALSAVGIPNEGV